MKYTVSNIIHQSMPVVVAKIKDPEGVKYWMEGLKRIEHISGTPGEVGAKREHYFLHKNKEMKVSETLLELDLPRLIKYAYDSPMGRNIVSLSFEKLDDNRIKQTNHTEMELKGFMKIMGVLFKGLFKKQSLKYMTGFKNYAESE